MENNKFFVEKIRFHLYKENTISFVGWYFDGHVRGREIQAFLDGKECDVQCDIHSGAEVRQKYLGNFNEINDEIIGMITLPQDWKKESVSCSPCVKRTARRKHMRLLSEY